MEHIGTRRASGRLPGADAGPGVALGKALLPPVMVCPKSQYEMPTSVSEAA